MANPVPNLSNYGVGNVISGKIYINRIFLNRKDLYDVVLKHELAHLNGDHATDLKEPFNLSMVWFCLCHPSTWPQLSPIWIVDGVLLYDKARLTLSLIAFYIMLALIISLKRPLFAGPAAVGLPFYALAVCYALLRKKKDEKT